MIKFSFTKNSLSTDVAKGDQRWPNARVSIQVRQKSVLKEEAARSLLLSRGENQYHASCLRVFFGVLCSDQLARWVLSTLICKKLYFLDSCMGYY